ncbi:MAG: PRC-barrel domain-containing protein [Rhodococcus sp. (in: high G+C Gram-positive bacteria)]|uniref:PRC-barrel domain-containing protein n=1 Tax=Rhodococcus sp. TaxID=1831 RepID=UPI002AD663B6|nr:PRC-barrel domain-containing protein [Rhodococcus sp. (in: high G+C Gram-positive bacteria)]
MLISEATGRKIVSTSTADTVGTVSGFLVDPHNRSIAGVQIKKSKSGNALPWSSISAFGSDAVTVGSADDIVDIDSEQSLSALSGKAHHFLGKRVLSTAGADLGKVDDIDFDAETGTITSLIVDANTIEGGTLIGIGSYAVVLDHRER